MKKTVNAPDMLEEYDFTTPFRQSTEKTGQEKLLT